jgi:hypothetical protein
VLSDCRIMTQMLHDPLIRLASDVPPLDPIPVPPGPDIPGQMPPEEPPTEPPASPPADPPTDPDVPPVVPPPTQAEGQRP